MEVRRLKAKKNLLVVEDDPGLRSQLEKMFSLRGIECVSVPNGMVALELLKRRAFQVVLTDISMPVMTGLELIHACRLLGTNCRFILFSGHADKDNAIQGLKLGAVDFIEKPFQMKDLLHSVESAFEKDDIGVRAKLENLNLSHAQIRITELLLQGLSNKQIANVVNLSEQGVKYHLSNLLEKFQVENRIDLRSKIRHLMTEAA
jgi:DNA-binding NarL/FixJ family response regulator